jgi:hypothetical protein
MLDSNRQNAPAPWTPYTTAGCNDGAVAIANTELEGTNDVANVYGTNSPQAHETSSQNNSDFVGISLHCARGSNTCAANGVPDLLPSQPLRHVTPSELLWDLPNRSPGPIKSPPLTSGDVAADRIGRAPTPRRGRPRRASRCNGRSRGCSCSTGDPMFAAAQPG